MLDSFCPIPKSCLTTHLSYHQFLLMELLDRALIAKTKSNPITRAEGATFKGPTFLPHV